MPKENWTQTIRINHDDKNNDEKGKDYISQQPFVCKGCTERFYVNIIVSGMNSERRQRHLEADRENMRTMGAINFRPSYDISSEFNPATGGLCPSCQQDAAGKFVSEKNKD
jgi:hypothetical protein